MTNSNSVKAADITKAPSTLMCFCLKTHNGFMPFSLSSTLKHPKTSMKTETFENASFLVWTGENGDVKGVTCHRFQSKLEYLYKMADNLAMSTPAQSQIPVVFIVFERFSVDR